MLVGWVDDVRPGVGSRKRGVGTCLNTVPSSNSRLGNEADPHGNKPEPVVRQLVSCTGTFRNVAECWTVGSWARGQAGQITRPGPEQPVPGDRQAANPAPTAPRTTSDEWDARRAAWPPAYRTCSPLSVGGGAKRSPDHLRKPSFRHRNLSGDYAHVYSLLSDLSDFIPFGGSVAVPVQAVADREHADSERHRRGLDRNFGGRRHRSPPNDKPHTIKPTNDDLAEGH